MSESKISRRRFLETAAVLPIPGALGLDGFLRWLPGGDDRSLVVLELDGGNDGLNTVLPVEDPSWARARPSLASVRGGSHRLDDGFALHPSCSGLSELMQKGLAAVIHGVGYEGSSRSHFKSRDVWHTADVGFEELGVDTTGWMGRIADQLSARGAAVPGLSVGSLQVPLILKASSVVVPSLNRIEDYQVMVSPGGDQNRRRAELREFVESEDRSEEGLRRFLSRVSASAIENAEKVRTSLARYRPDAEYPDNALGRKLQLLARIVISGFGTRLFHVNFPGFDTHASQLQTHEVLLQQLSSALRALVLDLHGHGKLDDVVVIVQSEFGRRVTQNQSLGTDHGKAAPVFVLGGGVRPGLHGEHPSLSDLADGDLRPTTDFRSVYAAAIRQLHLEPSAILGSSFGGLDLFA